MVLSPPVCNHQSIKSRDPFPDAAFLVFCWSCVVCVHCPRTSVVLSCIFLKCEGTLFWWDSCGSFSASFPAAAVYLTLFPLPFAPETWLYLDSRTRWSSWSTSWVDWRLWACSWKAATLCSSASSWTSMKRWLTLWHMQEYSSSSPVIH